MQCFPTPWTLYLKRKKSLSYQVRFFQIFFHLARGGIRIAGKNDNAMNRTYSTKERIDQARLLNKYDVTDITNSFKIPRSAKNISLQSNQLRLDWDSAAGNEAYSLFSSKRYKRQELGGRGFPLQNYPLL